MRYASYLLPKFSPDQDEAPAIVQEACLKAFRHLEEFRGDASLETYIIKIIRNEIFSRYRKSTTKRNYLGERQLAPEQVGDFDPLESQPSREPSALDNLIGKELEKKIARLPYIFRDVIKMELEEPDLSQKQKAEALGITLSAYKSRLLRARVMLGNQGYHN
ncbi:MAG: sigma-70 family RNA polymerase sigma factor [Patescibacteria group bacterium]|nr:sigma-70 family RNA polymerase sigma factor [Patescibacteria group bacterium]